MPNSNTKAPFARNRGLTSLRAVIAALMLVLPSSRLASAQADDTVPPVPADTSAAPASPDNLDEAAIQRCVTTLSNYGVTPEDASYLDALSLCYSFESAGDIQLDPLPVSDARINNGGACFAGGSTVRVSQPEIDEMTQWGRDNGRSLADVKGDIEALNVSRGGSGRSICPKSAAPQNAGVKCDSNFDSIDDAIAWERGRIQDTEAHLKQLEKQIQRWKIADQLSNWQVEFYVMDQILSSHSMAPFDPIPPDRKFAEIDRKYHKPRYGDFVSRDSMVLVDLSKAIPAWEASPNGRAARAEKDAYAEFDADGKLIGGTYKQKMDSINSYRSLPRNPGDIRNLGRPGEMLRQIEQQQDLDITTLRRAQQDLMVWQQAKANGVNCSFSTGQLGQPVFAPVPKAEPLFAYIFKGIGVVVATEKDATTTPACNWSGGGPRPCPNAKPAEVLTRLGGPYASMTEAKANLKTKLVCRSGYWGPQAQWGSGGQGLAAGGWHWLQNNVGLSDCKVVT